jgi:hypothetical protein
MEGRNPAAFLAGAAGGTERGERTVRQDLADRGGLKLEAALFLVRRALAAKLIQYDTYFRLCSIIELCNPQPGYLTSASGLTIPGRFFMSANLEGDIIGAIGHAAPRMRNNVHRAISIAVRRLLDAAEERAHKAGVPQAYAEHLREHMARPTFAEKQARARAHSWAREQLGNEAVAIATEDEFTLYHQGFLDD